MTTVVVPRLVVWWGRPGSAFGGWQPLPLARCVGCSWGHGPTLGAATIVGAMGPQAWLGVGSLSHQDALAGLYPGALVRVGPAEGPYWEGTVTRLVTRRQGTQGQRVAECAGPGSIADQVAALQGWDSSGQALGYLPPYGRGTRSAGKRSVGLASGQAYTHGGSDTWTRRDAVEALVLHQLSVVDMPGVNEQGTTRPCDVSACPDDQLSTVDLYGASIAAALSALLPRRQGLSWRATGPGPLYGVQALDLQAATPVPLALSSETCIDCETEDGDDEADVVVVAAGRPQPAPVWLEYHGSGGETGELTGTLLADLTLRSLADWQPDAAAGVADGAGWTDDPAPRSGARVDVGLLRVEPTGRVRLGDADLTGSLRAQADGPLLWLTPPAGATVAQVLAAATAERPLRIEARIHAPPPLLHAAARPLGSWPRVEPRTRLLTLGDPSAPRAAAVAVAQRELTTLQGGARWTWPGQLLTTVLPGDVIGPLLYDEAVIHPGPLVVETVRWSTEPLERVGTTVDCRPLHPREVRP